MVKSVVLKMLYSCYIIVLRLGAYQIAQARQDLRDLVYTNCNISTF